MLADISDVVTPMSENGEILKNIADDYTQADGSVYMIPPAVFYEAASQRDHRHKGSR